MSSWGIDRQFPYRVLVKIGDDIGGRSSSSAPPLTIPRRPQQTWCEEEKKIAGRPMSNKLLSPWLLSLIGHWHWAFALQVLQGGPRCHCNLKCKRDLPRDARFFLFFFLQHQQTNLIRRTSDKSPRNQSQNSTLLDDLIFRSWTRSPLNPPL
jgi:hypothetical protein